MAKPHKRPDPVPPLDELIALRRQKYPGMMLKDFCKLVGVTRLHVTSIEQGRRQPSLELALRWIEVLGPPADIRMFGKLPHVERRISELKRLKRLSPQLFLAA